MYKDFIRRVLGESSTIANWFFGNVTWSVKDGNSIHVLTEADLAIWSFLISEIQESFPSYNIIDEEAWVIDKESEYTWVIDPIDGTSNFAEWLPTYGIMLWLLHNDVPIAWGISLPFFDEILYGEEWDWVWLNDTKMTSIPSKELKNSLIAYCMDGHPEDPDMTVRECETFAKLVLHIRNMRMTWSAYDTVQVLKGKYWAFLNKSSMIRDNVAQQFLTVELWWRYTDFDWNDIDYTDAMTNTNKNYTHFFWSKEIHDEIMNVIH